MKRIILTLVTAVLLYGGIYAQTNYVAQPTHIIGKRINASGTVTTQLESDFSYSSDGMLYRFNFPSYVLYTNYSFSNGFLTNESTMHASGHPVYSENTIYTYEDGKLKTVSHLWGQMNANEYWQYDYYEDGRLKQKDYREEYEDFRQHYLYEYENEGKTRIEEYWTNWENQGSLLRKKTTNQYDDNYRIHTVLTENYSVEGALTSSTITTYSYTQSGKEESRLTQTLTDGEWVNTSIQYYFYDDSDRVIEQQNGSWHQENGDWNITNKVIFDLSNDGRTYTVSFYKKDGDNWVWDVFGNRTIFFESYMKIQQKALRYYTYEDMNGSGKINQFEITMEQTKEPTYAEIEKHAQHKIQVYPNPGTECVTVKVPAENAVVRFYDLQGHLLLVKPFDFQTDINTESWVPGIYLWEVWDGSQKEASGKWIKK